ncbi:methionyl-tRNA formyltransferase [Acididesulfobacillus acetoxydans]|uniref:Methionyl-tRNA formyltransferase n=1 Tax=Acididesulfobacillus acetoxydans TaxID=1561005 RepID=A0A8S0X0T5_9FIRM|nr:methionyl-tRNA formyltransferase [Acididesulfobacillus acetoxydans]CAA7602761.1 methionyl-tRNA formyltransferase [Acididesulfobacillus acetoxydans]CEJ06382.1 Methionyl-tRNA formyltransferase [Acididesulfobacillus acetoxydans]
MRLVFMGTPDFAVPSLEASVGAGYEVAGVFTQPDRPAGRGQLMKPSAVKTAALALGLPVFQPERVKSPEAVAQLRDLAPEGIVVVAYGQILSSEILALPRRGCINVHASLLPAYRGAAPIQWAVIRGEKVTGVTTMLMNQGLDTGDLLLQAEYPISAEAAGGEVHEALARLGATLLLDTLAGVEAGTVRPVPQTGPGSYAPLLTRKDEKIDWAGGSWAIHNLIRGLNPWPGAYTTFRGESLKVWQSSPPEEETSPGESAGESAGKRYTETGARNSPGEERVRSGTQTNYTRVRSKKTGRGQPAAGPEKSSGKTLAGVWDSGFGTPANWPGEVLRIEGDGLAVRTGDGWLKIKEVQPAGKRRMPARDFFLGRHGEAGERLGL